jgi:hypothetical protein
MSGINPSGSCCPIAAVRKNARTKASQSYIPFVAELSFFHASHRYGLCRGRMIRKESRMVKTVCEIMTAEVAELKEERLIPHYL